MKIADAIRDQIVLGDLAGWALALVILFCLRSRLRLSITLLWLLIFETFVDMGLGTVALIRDGSIGGISGTSWLIVVFYLPIVQVATGLTGWQLVTRRREPLD